jgi:gamma-glutamyltranspeptidase
MLGFGQSASRPAWERRRIGPVYAERGMVGAAHPLITATGVDVLQRGGNAIDAAVAAGVTAAVVMPEMCGLGGDLFAIVHDPATGRTDSFLGSGISPRNSTIAQMRAAGDGDGRMPYRGPLAVGVPGMVDAYFTLLDRFGTRTFGELAAHGTWYAEHGYPLTRDGAEAIATNKDLLSQFDASAAVFLPGGNAPSAGTRLKQADLGRTLRTIAANGPSVFYSGEIGERIIAYMQAHGGAMELSDFAQHKTTVAPPLRSSYRGNTVFQTGLPTQGMILLEALNIVEATGAVRGADDQWIHLLVEAKKLAYADRAGYARDPAFGDSRLEVLLSAEWAKRLACAIDPNRAASEVAPGVHQDGDTTYLCVVDRGGMMVSLIQSVSAAFGCGVVGGDTGVVLNNRVGRGFSLEAGHPNIYAPGKKTMHTLNCFMVADETGRMVVTGGTPGGDGQPQWNLQMISRLIDDGLDAQAAIEAPRWTSWPGTDPSSLPNPFELRIENRASEATIDGLAARGHVIKRQDVWGGGGAAQIIARDPESGILAGGTDPRVEGMIVGY